MRIRHAVTIVAAGMLLSILSTVTSTVAFAQSYQSGGAQNYPTYPSSGGGGGYGGYGYGGYGNGGTAASSYTGAYLNGMANVVRSAGYANVMNSIATQNYEQAYSADLDNRLKATNTYFENRRINIAQRAEARGPRATPAELAQYAAEAAPKRLTSSQLDPVTGEINWPAALMGQRYAAQRAAVDQLFSQRQATSEGASDYRAIVDAIDSLGDALKRNIADYSPAVFVEGRKFLDSLKYEARFVTS